ncbi:hypothetical protein CHS0354_038740 [Potamilus streckersoni]|uniref:RING-type domain-containing protein n=1 Tax=Potamilus streckersoni TaxID=2493646 RepID=A0AAE0W105_9BIVA|nr:hypothetical protein CHS0354_038740 [Potamilus streckersoni]
MSQNKKSDRAKRQELAQKVNEVKKRQENWLKQRAAEIKKSEGGATGKKDHQNEISLDPKYNSRPYDRTQYSSNVEIRTRNSPPLPRDKFQNWLKARQNSEVNDKNVNENGQDVNVLRISSARVPEFATPDPNWEEEMRAEELMAASEAKLMSPQNFDAVANGIISRVKRELQMTENKENRGSTLNGSRNQVAGRSNHGMAKVSPTGHRIEDDQNGMSQELGPSGALLFKDPVQRKENSDVQTEILSSHYCPACQQLMNLSKHAPSILIPCGHTLCSSCAKQSRFCPFCGSHIKSHTTNIMLQHIIEEYHNRGENSDGIRDRKHQSQNGRQGTFTRDIAQRDQIKYKEDLQNLATRQEILQEEIESLTKNIHKLSLQLKTEQQQALRIKQEERNVENQIQQLEEKLAILREHRKEYETKCAQIENQFTSEQNKLDMTKSTLKSLKEEVEKIKILVDAD